MLVRRTVLRKPAFCLLLAAGFALCVAAGCGGGGQKVKKYNFTRGQGHLRGVIYATESPAPGESPIYTVDFTQPTTPEGTKYEF